MGFILKEFQYEKSQGKMTLIGETEESNPNFFLRKKKNHRDFELPLEVKLAYETNNHQYKISIDMKEILKKQSLVNNEETWFIIMISGDKESQITINKKKSYSFDYFYNEETCLYRVKPYFTKDNTIAFYVKAIEVSAFIDKINYENGTIQTNIFLEGNDGELLKTRNMSLLLKKRNLADLNFYDDTIEIQSLGFINNKIQLELDISKHIKVKKEDFDTCWDVFLCISESKGNGHLLIPINIYEGYEKQRFSYFSLYSNEFYWVKPFFTGSNTLALFVSNSIYKFKMQKLIENTEYLNVIIEKPSTDLNHEYGYSLILKRRDKLDGKYEYYDVTQQYKPEVKRNTLEISIDKSRIFSSVSLKAKQVWDFFIRVEKNGEIQTDLYLEVPLEQNRSFNYFDLSDSHSGLKAKLFVNGSSRLSIYTDGTLKNNKTIKIAVLGTCFSRNAFNSSEYFNPGYKDIFSCVYTQFHSSIISLVSEKVNIDYNLLTDVNESDKDFLKVDAEKTFFKELKEKNVDYLIIDLYSDASKSLLKFNENQYISCSYFLEESKHIKDLNFKEIVDHSNNSHYFELWKEQLLIFLNEVKKVMPEERIILNKGRFTPTYYDENRSIKSFSDVKLIQRNNYFWDKIDNYFLHQMPKVKTIDLTDTEYIGDINYPFGLSFSHYQSEYYKEFFNRLTKIVLKDQIKG